ncbi:hypothetical protein [Brevibacillus brevis]|uniref:hypothetical protein n=1 Tax=Brevibacillus brevis TaxID=1393 RepID=UPI0011578F1A|nr:hypothetical protein [Lysinibacillus sp. SDF0063]TQR36361.1 hypothetical protein C7Y45_10680 [Lysinibacillus sp. SDF0063]
MSTPATSHPAAERVHSRQFTTSGTYVCRPLSTTREKRVSKKENVFVASRFVLPEHREASF